ncbi:MAG: type I restriction-modification system subunit M [Brevinema sp.]
MALDIEKKLWEMADKLRSNMDPGEYKHIILGLFFLKYISDKFEVYYNKADDSERADIRLYCEAENVFYVPEDARWEFIRQNAKTPDIGLKIDEVLRKIETENNALKGVLDKRYAKPDLNSYTLGEIVDLVSNTTLYTEEDKDILGRVYEYFLGKFASQEGKGGGEFYTPACVVKTLVQMIEPFHGRVYDPCCGSGGMFVQSGHFIEEHSGRIDDISVYGQESNPTTWRLCQINLAIRGIEGNIGKKHADTFYDNLHKLQKFEYIMANPPFNISDWGGDKLTNDVRWKFGVPPTGNANYAWLQHIYYHLSNDGVAGVVLANGSLSGGGQEGEIRKQMLEADAVDCIVAMPTQLFYTTGIPVCLWILRKDKTARAKFKDRSGEVLFIDARKLGTMVNRRLKDLSNEDMELISETYHEWRNKDGVYEDKKGFCASVSLSGIAEHDYVLTPGRYTGTEDIEDTLDFAEEFSRLSEELKANFAQSEDLNTIIRTHLQELTNEIE